MTTIIDWQVIYGWIGAPNTIRTCDPRLRRAVLYPAELWALREALKNYCTSVMLC